MNDGYTQSEVAEMLGVTKQTVYLYAKQKKILKIPDPYRLRKEVRYEKPEVDRLFQEKQQQPVGLRPAEVAKALGVNIQTIYKYIQSGSLKAAEVPYGDERISYVISKDDFESFKKSFHLNESLTKISKNEYYNRENDQSLFQLFQSQNILDLTARVSQNDKLDWGYYITQYRKWVSQDEGKFKYRLDPLYPIHKDKFDYKGYVHLLIPKDEDHLYPFIDFIYQNWGIENARLKEVDENIFFILQAVEIEAANIPFNIFELSKYVQQGIILKENDRVIFKSAYRKTSLDLPIEQIRAIKEHAELNGITMSQWVEKVIGDALNSDK
ncbi:helix-turn-helix domain-containing protein [Cytobacillus purgationiresistens]|uniref:DNA-binding transcriptional regulator AlpA n=1 Tax=Cytobacillus purgationiresistens TaxID=863449 RepID=A0ABU0AJ39_9BACI|nr:helix-turn-helix domain-containing protein [Cytobacillus purgationiresistens]MDQ0271274.1 putative DNA-binding transcriptional regulator AlpA [Cytobacillus purgationiresistens]